MRSRYGWFRPAALAAGAATLALLTGACSGGDAKAACSAEPVAAAPERPFRNFRIAYDGGLDFLDPGLSYTTQGWGLMWNVYLSLLGYRHVNGPAGATLVPSLAECLPSVSGDGLTYSFKLREGLTYSNGEPVRAGDVKYAIERLFRLDSPGVGFFTNIEGADLFARTRTGGISGIVADNDARTIELTLASPQGDFQNVLATVFAAPVPAGTAPADRSETPIPSTGPYRIAGYEPNRLVRLARNPHFVPTADVPAGNPDTVTVRIVPDDGDALKEVLDDRADWDYHPIPVTRLAEIRRQYPDRLKTYTPANTYYFFLNTRTKPFSDINVRKAVNYALDRDALVGVYGGLAAPTENVLPPTYPQYRKLALYPHDLAKAKALVKASGLAGTRVAVWGSTRDTSRRPVEYYVGVLNSLGFKATPRIVDAANYSSVVGNQATAAQTGAANWFQDYAHPLDWFDVLLNGDRITPTHNSNYSNADVPAINSRIDALKKEPTLTPEVSREWAQVDRMVADNALWAPYANRQFTDFLGRRVDTSCYVNQVLYQFDWSRICLQKVG